MRRHPARSKTPTRLQAIWRGLHARDANGRLHGVVGRFLRRLLGLRPISRPRDRPSAGGRAMNKYEPLGRKLDLRSGRVDLSHGSGGRAMARLIADVFHKAFDNDFLRAGNDQSAFDIGGGRMVMTTDGYVVSPLFFPGGDIGDLAVNGTINDIAMAGAKPLYMSASFIIEEGFPLADLARIAQSMGDA